MELSKFKLTKDKIFNIILLVLYAVLTFVTVLHHEIWGDEAQVWCLVRDTNFFELIKLVRIEGHPLLWYFCVLPFAKLIHCFNAVLSMQILNWLLVVAGMGLFVFKAPFSNWIKFGVLFSSGFLYWYPVLARSYCLIPILVFLLAMLYPKQKEHPYWYALLLILLANTHVIMFGFCGALALIFVYNSFKDKTKSRYIATGLIFASLLCIVLYLWGSWDDNLTVQTTRELSHTLGVKGAFFELFKHFYGFVNPFVSSLFGLFLLLAFVLFYIKDKKIFFVFLSSFLYQLVIYAFFWGLQPQRAYTIILAVLFGLWVLKDSWAPNLLKKTFDIVFVFILAVSIFSGIEMSIYDYFYEYSASKSTAKYIVEHVPEDAFILINYPFMSVAVSAYIFDNKNKWMFYSDKEQENFTYIKYNKVNAFVEPYFGDLSQYFLKKEDIYVLSAAVYFEDLNPIWESSKNYSHEQFMLYKLPKINLER